MVLTISWDSVGNTNTVEERERIEQPVAGKYLVKILDAISVPEKQYVLLRGDIAEGKYANVGARSEERYGNDRSYIKIFLSYKQGALPRLRSALKHIAEENDIPIEKMQEDFANTEGECLVDKVVGVSYPMEEYINGRGKKALRPGFVRIIAKSAVEDDSVAVPDVKKLPPEQDIDNLITDDPIDAEGNTIDF